MKKNTSITLDENMIGTLDEMRQPEHHDRNSFSDMVSHLIKTNPKYIEWENNKRRSGKKQMANL